MRKMMVGGWKRREARVHTHTYTHKKQLTDDERGE